MLKLWKLLNSVTCELHVCYKLYNTFFPTNLVELASNSPKSDPSNNLCMVKSPECLSQNQNGILKKIKLKKVHINKEVIFQKERKKGSI